MIEQSIRKLVCYGLEHGLFTPRDEIFVTNGIMEVLGVDSYSCDENFTVVDLESTLKEILDYAVSKGFINDTVTERDLFDTKIMATLLPRPSEVEAHFNALLKENPKSATNYYFELSKASDYIRTYRVARDMRWKVDTKYGELDITVNLSKPEKDPKEIAAAKAAPQSSYPKCLLCKECEGYSGRMNFPARQNHRVISLKLNDRDYFLQYSPYVYYNEHCIVFNKEHIPMSITEDTFRTLLSFVEKFPHYFIGSNADLPIVGGSILSHDHFQGGNYTFAMAKAGIETPIFFDGFSDVKAGIVKWPMSVIRISGKNIDTLARLGGKILAKWRTYSDEKVGIFAETEGEPHNTITPIARFQDGEYQLDLVLRNNITSAEHPLGVFHPHAELHHIKKENIGLIEVMGLAVLPSRLKAEMETLKSAVLNHEDVAKNPTLAQHADWVKKVKRRHTLTKANIDSVFNEEIGKVFAEVLVCCGVFKRNRNGLAAFGRFVDFVNRKD